MIQRRITFTHSCGDGQYGRICEQAEKDGYFVKCWSYAHKVLWVQFESEEKEREWLVKVGLTR